MNWGKLGRWVLLAGSLVLGLVSGVVGFWIFESKVPAAMQTAVLSTESRVYYLGAGLVFGFLIFGWTMVAVAIARRAGEAKGRREPAAK